MTQTPNLCIRSVYACALISILIDTTVNVTPTRTPRLELNIGVLIDARSASLRPFLERKIHERNKDQDLQLHPYINVVDIADSFIVSNAMCDLINKNVIAIIGVTNSSSLATIQSYSNTFQMPFITVGPTQNFTTGSGFQLYVRPSYMGAVVDLLHYYGCRKAVYMYDSDEGLMRIQDLFQSLNTRDLLIDLDVRRVNSLNVAKDIIGTLVGLDHVTKGANRNKLFLVMDMEYFSVLDIMHHLKKEGRLANVDVNIISVGLDTLPISSTNSDLIGANISGFQLGSQGFTDNIYDSIFTDSVQSTEALLTDVVAIVRGAVEETRRHRPDWFIGSSTTHTGHNIKCTNFIVDKTPHGLLLMEELRKVNFEGETGMINFDGNGKRCNFSVDVFKSVSGDPNRRTGKWHPDFGLFMSSIGHIEMTIILLVNNTRPIHFVQAT